MIGFNGGLIGKERNPAFTESLPGVWTLQQQVIAQSVGNWPNNYDADARVYIAAVETADGQQLELGVRDAINDFVVGCKDDNIWSAIKASCILAGARTLSGALVPLVGTAPTNFNFVSGDYNRETGLIGNGSTKYLNANRASNTDPQNNHHLSVYVSTAATTGVGANTRAYIGVGGNDSGATHIVSTFTGSPTGIVVRNRTSTGTFKGAHTDTGFLGMSRNASASYLARTVGSNATINLTSETSQVINNHVFATNWSATSLISNPRIAFYSIGENLDLALLDSRVTTLISDIAAAIP
jgi:hypothetical protein